MRRISQALDAGGIEADAALRARLVEDVEAAAYARDLQAIDAAVRTLPRPGEPPDWEALAARIEEGLDTALEDLEDIGDVTAPPELDDAESRAATLARPEPRPVLATTGELDPASSRAADVGAPSNTVELASRRRRRGRRTFFAAIGGLAAAAAVGLGITTGLSTFASREAAVGTAPATPISDDRAPEEEVASAAAEALPDEPLAQAAPLPAVPPRAPPSERESWTGAGYLPSDDGAGLEMPAAAATRPLVGLGRASSSGAEGARGATDLAALPQPAPNRGGLSQGLSRGGLSESLALASTEPPGPSRAAIIDALRPAEDRVRRCMGDRREVAHVELTVRGSDGRVTAVHVGAPFAGTPADACIQAVLRSVTLPTSANSTYPFQHAFRPAPVAGTGSFPPNAARSREAPSSAPIGAEASSVDR